MRLSSSQGRMGLYLGIVLIGATLRAPITGLGPILPALQHEMGLNGTAAGFLNALPLLIFAILSPVMPGLGRRFGLERLLGGAMVVLLAGMLLRSLPVFGGLWIGTALIGMGIVCGNVLLPGLVKRDFAGRSAGVIAVYVAAMASVAALATGLAQPVAVMMGWRWSLGVWAVLVVLALLVWVPQFRVPQHRLAVEHQDQDEGVSPWRHPVGWQVALFFALQSLVFYSVLDWFASYAGSLGVKLSTAGYQLFVLQIVAVVANLGAAPMLKRLKDQKLLGFLCGIFLVVGTAGLVVLPQYSLIWLTSIGLEAGAGLVLVLSLFGLRTRDHHQAVRLSGMAQCVGYLGSAAGPVCVGYLHDMTGRWDVALWLLVLASMGMGVFAVLAGRRRVI